MKLNRDFRFTPKKMPELEIKNILDGCYGLGDKPTDYILTEGLLNGLPTLYQQDEIIYEYNQFNQKRSQKSCTLFSPVGALSDLWNIELDLAEIKERDEESYNKGRRKDNGWRVALGVEHIVDCWNGSKHGKELGKVAYYSFELRDNQLLQNIFKKRYTVCTGYDGNADYNNDKNKDGVLNGTEFGKTTYGHAVNTIRGINSPARIKDNYKGIKYNIYDVEHEFSEIPCFFSRGYILTKVKEDNLERVKELNEMNRIVIDMIENNSRMRHLTNDEKYRKELNQMNNANRQKQKDIEQQLILLS